MATYKIRWKRSAVKDLQHLPKEVVKKIYNIVSNLSSEPFPSGVRKLVGSSHSFRIRLSDYRIIYSIESEILTIEIVRIGHRKEVYK